MAIRLSARNKHDALSDVVQLELPLTVGNAAPPMPEPVTVTPMDRVAPAEIEAPSVPAFGRWLSGQAEAAGSIGVLARAIRTDPAFSRRATPDDLRRRLAIAGAEPDLFEAVDDAEAAWLLAA